MICARCGGPTKGQDMWEKSHRYYPDCISHLKAGKAELYEALSDLHLFYSGNRTGTGPKLWENAIAALAKARGEQS